MGQATLSAKNAKLSILSWSDEARHTALATFERGGLCAFKTETVYGLGADATNPAAVARVFEAKGRPSFNPLISHVATKEMAQSHGELNEDAQKLATEFWPGPLTLVVPRKESSTLSELACAGLKTVALRIPNARIRELLNEFGKPVAAPSANRSGHISPVTAQHVQEDLEGRIDLILDDGPCEMGLESTVVSCFDGEVTLLRPGIILKEELENILQKPVLSPTQKSGEKAPVSPGLLKSHYAPNASLRLNAECPIDGEAYLAFGPLPSPFSPDKTPLLNLSKSGDIIEAAANLYSHLRKLDAMGVNRIAVAPIHQEGLGAAINDRLMRAAAPRD